MSAAENHNEVVPLLLRQLVEAAEGEAAAMVMLESLTLGVMLMFRPEPREAGEFLDMMTAQVIERLQCREAVRRG